MPTTTTFNFDRTDELVNQSTNGGGSWTSFAFDAYGNTTTSVDKASATTTSAYDAADRLKTLTPPAGSTAASFTFDALGRTKTRVVGGNTDAYWYAGTTETVHQIVTTGLNPATLTSVVDPAGSRLTTSAGSLAYALPDLHGSTAGLENASRTLTAAYRYDGYGQGAATFGSVANPWRYQGRLDVGSDASNPLYDAMARFYSPQLGAFTQLDSTRGEAVRPKSMNRFAYAGDNPSTFVDRDGHATFVEGQICSPLADLCKSTSGTLTINPNPAPEPLYPISTTTCSSSSCGPTAPILPGPGPVQPVPLPTFGGGGNGNGGGGAGVSTAPQACGSPLERGANLLGGLILVGGGLFSFGLGVGVAAVGVGELVGTGAEVVATGGFAALVAPFEIAGGINLIGYGVAFFGVGAVATTVGAKTALRAIC